MIDKTADGFSQLIDLLFEGSFNETINRFRSPFVFRGMNDKNSFLLTSLNKLGGEHVYLERNLIRNFKKYSPKNLVEKDSIWHWLYIAQHHGLPTRQKSSIPRTRRIK